MRQDADVGVGGECCLEAGDTVAHARHGGLVEDHDVAAAAEAPRDVLAQKLAALAVVAGDMRDDRAAVGRDVGREHGDVGAVRFFDGAGDAARVDGRDHDRVHALRDEVLDLRGLSRQIALARHDLEVDAQTVGGLLHAAAQVLIEHVRFGEQGDAHLRARRPLGAARAERRNEGQHNDQGLTHGFGLRVRAWSRRRTTPPTG